MNLLTPTPLDHPYTIAAVHADPAAMRQAVFTFICLKPSTLDEIERAFDWDTTPLVRELERLHLVRVENGAYRVNSQEL